MLARHRGLKAEPRARRDGGSAQAPEATSVKPGSGASIMICWRIDVRRNFSRYLDGELDERLVARVEDHLLDCLGCRARLSHIRDGHRLAGQMPRLRPERDVWAAIEAGIEAVQTPRESPAVARARWAAAWRNFPSAGRLAAVLGIVALLFATLFLL